LRQITAPILSTSKTNGADLGAHQLGETRSATSCIGAAGRLAPPSLPIFTRGLTGTRIEDELTSSGDRVFKVVVVEIEHVPKRSSQLVERSAPDLAGAPILLDKA
jgi:hypothetical protein